jgi:hypothetical protein
MKEGPRKEDDFIDFINVKSNIDTPTTKALWRLGVV